MSLDGIRYIFQIPLAWFKRVGAFVENSYGNNGISIRRDRDGAAEIAVDMNEVKSAMSGEFVTVASAQTITGAKTITGNDLTMGTGGKGLKFKDGAGNFMTLRGYGGTSPGFVMYLGSSTSNTIIAAGASSGDMSFGVGATGNITIGGSSTGALSLGKANDDSTSTSSLRIATMGWVNSKFFRPSASDTGVVYNTSGTISYKSIGTGANDVAAGNHTHNYAALTSTAPSTPRTAVDSQGTAQSADVGTATTAARADHIHLLPSSLVTTFGSQTITGEKTHRANIIMESTSVNRGSSSGIRYIDCHDADSVFAAGVRFYGNRLDLMSRPSLSANTIHYARLNSSGLTIWNDANTTSGARVIVGYGSLELYHSTPFIDFHYALSSDDYTARIIESASGQLQLVSSNHAILSVHPEDTDLDTTSTSAAARQIATCGWVNGKFISADSSSSGIVYNDEGTIGYIDNANETQSITVVTDVVWTGTKLQKKTKSLTFTYGVLTTEGSETTTDVDTAVTYNPS